MYILGLQMVFKTVECSLIFVLLLLDYEDFFLIIHNIDGVTLRGAKTQTLLSLLAGVRGIHVIATIDHINAPLSKYEWSLEGF